MKSTISEGWHSHGHGEKQLWGQDAPLATGILPLAASHTTGTTKAGTVYVASIEMANHHLPPFGQKFLFTSDLPNF